MTYANLVVLAATMFSRRRRTVVVTEHSEMSTAIRLQHRASLTLFLIRMLYSRASTIVGVSDAVVSDLVKELRTPPAKTVRIYNPVDLDRIRAAGATHVDHPWLVEERYWKTVACVGNFKEAKGHHVLIDACALLTDQDVRMLF